MNIRTSDAKNSSVALQSISSIAAELFRDIEQIYHPQSGTGDGISDRSGIPAIDEQIDSLHGGVLLVVAVRDKGLKEAFCLEVVQHVALRKSLSIAFYNFSESYLRFTRKLIDELAQVPSDAGIYDGLLNEIELQRLASALWRLSRSHIHINPSRSVSIDQLCAATQKQFQMAGGVGLILVDCVQKIMGSNARLGKSRDSLIRLKQLATELDIPAVAIYQLDPADGKYSSTLMPHELGEIGALARLPTKFVLLSSTPGKIVFTQPKIQVQTIS
jgi:replicative DNA helicase